MKALLKVVDAFLMGKKFMWVMRIAVGITFLWMMVLSVIVHEWLGLTGYLCAFVWFAMFVLSDARVELYKTLWVDAANGWKTAMDRWGTAIETIDLLKARLKPDENVSVSEAPQSPRKGRSLGAL